MKRLLVLVIVVVMLLVSVIPASAWWCVDIKYGSNPNGLNLSANGVVSAVVWGYCNGHWTAGELNPETARLAGASPLRWAYEDVDGDGTVDLVFHFARQDLQLDCSSTKAGFEGNHWSGAFTNLEGNWNVDFGVKIVRDKLGNKCS